MTFHLKSSKLIKQQGQTFILDKTFGDVRARRVIGVHWIIGLFHLDRINPSTIYRTYGINWAGRAGKICMIYVFVYIEGGLKKS